MVLLGTHNRHLEPWRHTFLLSKVAASSGELQLPLGESASSWVTNFVVLTASRPSLCVVLETQSVEAAAVVVVVVARVTHVMPSV